MVAATEFALDCSTLPELYDYQAAVDAAFQGKGYREIAQAMGCCVQTLMRMRYRYPILEESIARARKVGLDNFADEQRYLVDDNQHLAPVLVRTKWEVNKWLLAVSDPGVYGDRMIVREEHVDLKGALAEAKTRVINATALPAVIDPFE